MKLIISILIQFIALSAILGQAGRPMTLEQCIIYAVEHSPVLKSQRLETIANDYNIKSIRAQGLPQVSANGSYSYNYALAEQILPGEIFGMPGESVAVKFGVANTIVGSIEANQLIYSKSYSTGLKAAQASQDLIGLNTFQATENLIYDIVNVYLNINLTQKNTGLLDANLQRINQLIDIAQIQFEEGLIKKIDVDQLKVNRTNLLSEQRNLNTGIKQQMNLLKFYMGLKPDSDITLASYELEEEGHPLVKDLIINENTDLKVLDMQMDLTSYEIENTRAGFYPSLSAFANYGWQGQTDKLFSNDDANKIQGSPTGVLGLRLSVPIFDGFQKKNSIAKIKIQQEQLSLNRENLVNSIEMRFDNANETLTQNKIILEAQKENMKLAEELYNATKLSYQEGVAPLTELLNAETSLKEAQTQYLQSLLNVKIAELDHLQSSGQLSKLIRETVPTNN